MNMILFVRLLTRRPPLPDGFKLGEAVYFTGASETAPNGENVVHGQKGSVAGAAPSNEAVAVQFPDNKGSVSCFTNQVRSPRAAAASPAHMHLHPPRPPHPLHA
jgi:hypothetical protein